jgi:hypothetical protein
VGAHVLVMVYEYSGGAKGFVGGLASTARHPLYLLCGLAVLVLDHVPYVDKALIAAVMEQALKG